MSDTRGAHTLFFKDGGTSGGGGGGHRLPWVPASMAFCSNSATAGIIFSSLLLRHLGMGGCKPRGAGSRAPGTGPDVLLCLPTVIGWPSSRSGGSCSSSAWTAHVRTALWWRRCAELCPGGRPSSAALAWLLSWRRGGKTRGWSTWRSPWEWMARCTSCTRSECPREAGREGTEAPYGPHCIWQATCEPPWLAFLVVRIWESSPSSLNPMLLEAVIISTL